MNQISGFAGHFAAQRAPRLVVGIATTGRAGILKQTLAYMAGLKDQPDLLIISAASVDDVTGVEVADLPFPAGILIEAKGLCRQRNRILKDVDQSDILLFLDDDFLIAEGYLAETRRLFADHDDLVVATGQVLVDGILGPGLSHADGVAVLARSNAAAPELSDTRNGYGCNMAIRVAPVVENALWFDEALPAYSWLEDVDFSRQLAPIGRIVKAGTLQGVHLGTKTGRSRGTPLGYSQVANPLYLARKGTLARSSACIQILRNCLANIVKSFRPEPWVDRSGRRRGNWLALRDALRNRADPSRAADL